MIGSDLKIAIDPNELDQIFRKFIVFVIYVEGFCNVNVLSFMCYAEDLQN